MLRLSKLTYLTNQAWVVSGRNMTLFQHRLCFGSRSLHMVSNVQRWLVYLFTFSRPFVNLLKQWKRGFFYSSPFGFTEQCEIVAEIPLIPCVTCIKIKKGKIIVNIWTYVYNNIYNDVSLLSIINNGWSSQIKGCDRRKGTVIYQYFKMGWKLWSLERTY